MANNSNKTLNRSCCHSAYETPDMDVTIREGSVKQKRSTRKSVFDVALVQVLVFGETCGSLKYGSSYLTAQGSSVRSGSRVAVEFHIVAFSPCPCLWILHVSFRVPGTCW